MKKNFAVIVPLLWTIFTINAYGQSDTSDFSPSRNKRVDELVEQAICSHRTFSAKNITDNANGRLQNSYKFSDIDMSSYELITSNLTFSDKDNAQKLLFAPLMLIPIKKCQVDQSKFNNLLYGLKINFSQKSGTFTSGIGLGFNNFSPYTKRSKRIVEEVFGKIESPKIGATESLDSFKKNKLEKYEGILDSAALRVYELRAMHQFSFTIGYNAKFFGNLSLESDDPQKDSLNYYWFQANVLNSNISYGYDRGKIIVSAGINWSNERKNAAKLEERVPYLGASFSFNWRIFRFIQSETVLRKTENYKKSLFIPGLHIGCVYEYVEAKTDQLQFIKDKIKKSNIITPNIDIVLAPAAQFRISLPITFNRTITDEKTAEIGSAISYVLKMSSL